MDEAIRFREDKCKWYFHLTYTAAVHSKSKRVTVEDPDESYLQGTEAIIDHWHLDDDDPDMNDEVRMEETVDTEAESGGVDPDCSI